MEHRRRIYQMLLLVSVQLFTLTGCIYETLPECPTSIWFAPVFTLHTETNEDGSYKDLFGQTAGEMAIYFFDAEGRYVGQSTADGPFGNDFRIGCPITEAGDYQAVLWVNGKSSTTLNVTPVPDVTTINELYLSLKEIENNVITQQFPPLLYGRADKFTITDHPSDSQVIPVSFIRDSHKVEVTVRWRTKNGKELCNKTSHAGHTRMYIRDNNGIIDFGNQLRPCDPLTYVPHYFSGDELEPYKDPAHPDAVTLAGQFSVMRLLTGSKTQLIFTTVNESGAEETIGEYDLLEWMKATKAFSQQEDIDRSGTFHVYLEFLCDDESAAEDSWVAVNITINGWQISNMGGEDL